MRRTAKLAAIVSVLALGATAALAADPIKERQELSGLSRKPLRPRATF